MSTLTPELNVHNDELDPMGLTAHSKHSMHSSAQGDNGASMHQLDHASEHPSHPHSKEPSHAGPPVDPEQPPPIPHANHNPNFVGGDVYLEPQLTTAERIQDNIWLAILLVIATALWIMALVSQAIVANLSNDFVRTAWLALILQLLLIILTTWWMMTTHLPPYHIQISTLAAMVVVLGSLAVDRNLYTPNTSSQKAMAAAWILICILDIFFILYFTAPPQHPLVALMEGGYGQREGHTEAYRKSNFFAGAPSNRNTVTGYPMYPPNRLSRAGSGNIELGPVGNRLSMARSQSGRPLSGIPETTASGGGARSSGGTGVTGATGVDDGVAHQRPQLQQGESARKSGRFSLYRKEREKEKEREREREKERERDREAQQQGQIQEGRQLQGGAGLAAPGQESVESRPPGKPVLCRAEAMFACEFLVFYSLLLLLLVRFDIEISLSTRCMHFHRFMPVPSAPCVLAQSTIRSPFYLLESD